MADQPKPYIVRTTTGVLVKEYMDMEKAQASATDRNERAEGLGIDARYEAVNNPAAA